MEAEWKKHGYPGVNKFYKIMKKTHTMKQVDEFILSQKTNQLHKKSHKQIQGHIIAYHKNALWFMDLLDMSNFSRQNHGFKWILLCIDTFTRKAYAQPLKTKSKYAVKEGFAKIYQTDAPKIKLILSDSGNEFLNQPVQSLFKDLKMKHDTVEIGDHHALGIIDRLSRTIKEIIYKDFTETETVKWVDHLQEYITAYNSRPHGGILGYAPNEAEDHKTELVELNLKKSMPTEHNFHVGDLVRFKLKRATFNKGYKEIWSRKQYTIESIDGVHAVLSNKDKYRLDDLQHVVPVETKEETDMVVQAEKSQQVERKLKHEGVERANIVEKRLRSKNIL